MSLPDFHVSEPFTLGVELELQVVNPPGYDLSQDSTRLIDALQHRISAGEVKHDITESMLEIATGVCRDIRQVAHQFSAMHHAILQAAGEHHVQICGGGTHPFQKWQRQQICADERYARTLEMFGYLMQQATVFGQHVHVGCTNGDDAIYLLHGLSFEGLFRRLSYTSMIESIKDLHWDIRPSPGFGTVEVRVMDTPLTISHAVSLAGFIQALSHWLLAERPFKFQERDYLLYKFNRFQACRFGLKGVITDVHTGEQRTIADDVSHLLEKIAPWADKLNASSALDEIAVCVKRGKSEAQLMREFIADGGSLIGLMKKHTEIWAAG